MSDTITLTKELLDEIKTIKGGYNRKQLNVLDISWPPKSGWKQNLIGTIIDKYKFIKYVQSTGNIGLVSKYCEQLEIDPKSLIKRPAKLNKKEKHKIQKELKQIEKKEYILAKIKLFGIDKLIQELNIHYISFNFFHKKIFNKLSLIPDDKTLLHANDMLKKYSNQRLHRSKSGRVVLVGYTNITTLRNKQYLYIIRAVNTGHVKIGVSTNPFSRLKELQTSNPYTLKISLIFDTDEQAFKLEKKLHSFFNKSKMRGEWFDNVTDEEIITFIGSKAIQANIKQVKNELQS